MNSLLQKIQKHMMRNPMEAAQGDYDFSGKGEELMEQVRALKPKKCSNKGRLQCAQFIIMHYTMEAMQLGKHGPDNQMQLPDAELLDKFKVAQTKDMLLAWELLSARAFSSNDEVKAAAVLKIDISQRLEDSMKLSETFKEFTRRQLATKDVMVAITAAPFLADWKAAKNLIRKAERSVGRQMLDAQWHSMAQSMPIPDYSILFKMADEHKLFDKPTPNPKDLTWITIQVAKIRVKFAHVDCGPFKDKAAELLNEISNNPIEWEDVPSGPNVQIKKMGGFYQTVSFGDMPMSLCGPYVEENKLHVIGKVELVMQDPATTGMQQPGFMMDPSKVDPSKIIVQREEWVLEKVPDCVPSVWKGKYMLNQGPMKQDVNNPETAPVNMRFYVEIYEKGPDGKCHPVVEEVNAANAAVEEKKEYKIEKVDIENKFVDNSADINEKEVANKAHQVENIKPLIEKVITEIDDLEMD